MKVILLKKLALVTYHILPDRLLHLLHLYGQPYFLFLLLTLLVQYSFEFWNYHCQLVNLSINQSVWLTWNEMIVVRFTTGSTDRNVNWDTSDIKQACMPTTQNISIILTWIWVHIWVFKKTVYCILIYINTKYNLYKKCRKIKLYFICTVKGLSKGA